MTLTPDKNINMKRITTTFPPSVSSDFVKLSQLMRSPPQDEDGAGPLAAGSLYRRAPRADSVSARPCDSRTNKEPRRRTPSKSPGRDSPQNRTYALPRHSSGV